MTVCKRSAFGNGKLLDGMRISVIFKAAASCGYSHGALVYQKVALYLVNIVICSNILAVFVEDNDLKIVKNLACISKFFKYAYCAITADKGCERAYFVRLKRLLLAIVNKLAAVNLNDNVSFCYRNVCALRNKIISRCDVASVFIENAEGFEHNGDTSCGVVEVSVFNA